MCLPGKFAYYPKAASFNIRRPVERLLQMDMEVPAHKACSHAVGTLQEAREGIFLLHNVMN